MFDQLELFPELDTPSYVTCRLCGEELYDCGRYGVCGRCDHTNSLIALFDEKELTKRDLYEEAKRFCKSSWEVHYTGGIEIVKRRRWKWRLGAYDSYRRTIRMCHVTMREAEKNETYDTLHHELIHWYLHVTGQPYRDTDFCFIEECLRLDVGLSGARDAREAYQRFIAKRG